MAARDVEMEVERYRAKAKGRSHMPVTYALCALVELYPERRLDLVDVQKAVQSAVRSVERELGDVLESDPKSLLAALVSGLRSGRPVRRAAAPGARPTATRAARSRVESTR